MSFGSIFWVLFLVVGWLCYLGRKGKFLMISARVVAVLDGDTIDVVDEEGTRRRIRLLYLDAPEIHQLYGPESREVLVKAIYGEMVTVQLTGQDVYDRDLGVIRYEGREVNFDMVRCGHAWTVQDSPDNYKAASVSAQARRIGLWEAERPMPPWDFRKLEKAGLAP